MEHESRSPIFALADDYIERTSRLSPMSATKRGLDAYDDRLDDFSFHAEEEERRLVRSTIDELETLEPADDIDRLGRTVMVERLSSSLSLIELGERRRTFSALRSPASAIRNVFELQPANTPEHAEKIRARLYCVRASLESWQETLDEDSSKGWVPARRQSLVVASQLEAYASGGFGSVAMRAARSSGLDADEVGLSAGADDAEQACRELAGWLRAVHVPRAGEEDAVGEERYRLWVGFFCGAELDLEATYRWGWEELKRTNEAMWELAEGVAPGARTLEEVAAALDADDDRVVEGTSSLLERLRALTEGAIEMLDGTTFDIDERIRFCDARLAPEGSMAAPYYTGPSEDLRRPGITWYPTLGRDRFPLWRDVSTWYHESVPGHHLQVASSMLLRDSQTRFQRLDGAVSGYSEGWALYAERLMHELGALSDPADEMGYLTKQAMRAARVVVDIGMHLRLVVPGDVSRLAGREDVAGSVWDADLAVALLMERALVMRARAVSEVDRYLGLPGQAIAYKVGERVFLDCRADARRRLGDSFDLKAWHAQALRLGPMGLDTFAAEMATFADA